MFTRYRGLVPLDAPASERVKYQRSPASVTDVSADAAARAAKAMADAMADDEDYMADGAGGDEHAACDALALEFLRADAADAEISRFEAEGEMAMALLSTADGNNNTTADISAW